MEPLIYYPTFEPPSDIWLKFAILYFENFKPIIPYRKQYLISNDFRRIQEDTDLITLYSPEYDEGYRASLQAIEVVEKILNNTHERSYLFKQINILRKWQDSNNWVFFIFREKFSEEWGDYCTHNHIGRQNEEGIFVSEELAFLFMTYLAKEIAFKESAAVITDNNKYDNFANYSRSYAHSFERQSSFAKGIINLLVPQNLSNIPFSRLIEFRNRNRNLIKAFNNELDNVQNRISQGYTNREFIESYNDIYSEISREIIVQGTGIASIPFAAYMAIHNPQAILPDYIKEVLGGLGMILGGGYSLSKIFRDTQTKRYCKKYLTNLERLR